KAVLHHAACHEAHAGLDARGPRLAGELVVRRSHRGGGPDCLPNRAGGGLDRVGVGLASHVDRADLLRVDRPPPHCIPCCFHRDGRGVLVEIGDRFRIDSKPPADIVRVRPPDPGDLFYLDAKFWYIHTVCDDAYHCSSLSMCTTLSTSISVQSTVILSFSAIFGTSGCTSAGSIP